MQENKNELWRISEEVVKNEESRHIIITSEEESISPTGMKLNIKNCSDENVIPVSYTHLTLPTKA